MNWTWLSLSRGTTIERLTETLNRRLKDLEGFLRGVRRNGSATVFPGSVGYPTRTVTTDATLTDADYMVRADTTGGDVTITLPDGADRPGQQFAIKKLVAANNVIVQASGGTIDGAANHTFATALAAFGYQANENGDYDII